MVDGGLEAHESLIKAIVSRWDQGWADFDAALASRDYAEDADWINAFGVFKHGRKEIFQYLRNIYHSPQVTSRRSTSSISSIHFIRPDIAVVTSYRETAGQKTASGAEYPLRKTRDLRVLAFEHGLWKIASHLVADEKAALP
ncbi:SgcJ/EcaC family oxidoreductase [Methylobacillus sp.]|uniref:SgcJ/EcaC family oxidoreductase n=1 Tax=Methylobacillus sp. TaxID=56818 RepID=UPI00257D624D|nr:SgcJ/EcaC family oxidoreductase [Methylobacillus sp.]